MRKEDRSNWHRYPVSKQRQQLSIARLICLLSDFFVGYHDDGSQYVTKYISLMIVSYLLHEYVLDHGENIVEIA